MLSIIQDLLENKAASILFLLILKFYGNQPIHYFRDKHTLLILKKKKLKCIFKYKLYSKSFTSI